MQTIVTVSVAAATAIVGADLLAGKDEFKVQARPRFLKHLSFTGSAAAGDCEIDIMIGSDVAGNVFNTATGAPTNTSTLPVNIFVPSNAVISARVRDAAATNPVFLFLAE